MANFNKVFLMGNLTRDPELRYTAGGTAVAGFGVAVNRRFKRQDGEQHEETCFVDVTAWGRQAEVVSEYLKKGRPIFLEGRLQLDSWEDKQGQKRNKLKVVLENFQFIGGRDQAGGQGGGAGQRTSPPTQDQPAAEDAPEGSYDVKDDDIPF